MMTERKTIELLKSNEKYSIPRDMMHEAENMAIQALEKQEKYKWHDLRENPDDLPEKYEEVLIYGSFGYCVGALTMTGWYNGTITSTPVIAWKEIEPFYGLLDGTTAETVILV